MQRNSSVVWLLSLALLVCVGCGGGPRLVPVKGSVKVDGKPAAGAVVTFHIVDGGMEAFPSTAITGEDGSFTLTTGEKGGAQPGKYKVTVVWPDPTKKPTQAEMMMGATAMDGPDLLNGKYATSAKSGLECEIKSGATDIAPFDLKM
jgi:hypothetical protein